ncbi:hypothetical protein BEWA_024280 [Theileria equi strain WA]|uniref:Thrombospondin type 1 domain-containing protein n=1 Tax=Theileria equi strain WA TaxID=1537102 RepID=L0AXE6_THEEQ|nr:hypothetical protein BEWA_024280 [Theileria equi strain WA]AFZ79579.1 hypothetical protein BEWA_024280 [Theileria equi strain WA]|eukprot:XP_004829245.1 hypothetical protein BEWA_024280 [Theileria equi strain WA]
MRIGKSDALDPQTVLTRNFTTRGPVTIRCKSGHFINIISANITCNGSVVDATLEFWNVCRNKTKCIITMDNIETCFDPSGTFGKTEFTCSKLYALDCGLFHPRKAEDQEFCMRLCLGYIDQCRSKKDFLPRVFTLKCIEKLFRRNSFNKRCIFLLGSIRGENNDFKWDSYLMNKFETGRVVLTNMSWSYIKYTKPIENPIIIPSMANLRRYVKVNLFNVTNIGFQAKLLVIDCLDSCKERRKEFKSTIGWLAISVGDHSPYIEKRLQVGALRGKSSIILPLDPRKEWIILAQIQKIETEGGNIPRVFHTILTGDGKYTIEFLPKERDVVIGYIAFEADGPHFIHDADVVVFSEVAESVNVCTISINIPRRWPKNIPMYGNTLHSSIIVNPNIQSNISSLRAERDVGATSDGKINLWNLKIEYIVEKPTITLPPIVHGIVIEDEASILLKRICKYCIRGETKNETNSTSNQSTGSIRRRSDTRTKRFCFKECKSLLGKCIDAENIRECYAGVSKGCRLLDSDMLLDSIISYKRAIAINEKRKVKENDVEIIQPPEPTPVSPVEKEKNKTIVRDCLEGPWGEWSKCSNYCRSETVKSQRVRKRVIYAKNIGSGSRPCITVETQECLNLPNCSEFCLKRAVDGVEHFFIWSKDCKISVDDLEEDKYAGNFEGLKSGVKGTESPGCKVDDNWSSCDAPCDLGNPFHEHLRIPLACSETKRECRVKPEKCRVQQVNPRCFLSNTVYDMDEETWVKNDACICMSGTVCTAEEIYMGEDYDDLLSFENISRVSTGIKNTAVQLFISVANGRRVNIPVGFLKEITYGKFNQEELQHFCATGGIRIEPPMKETLWTDCRLADSNEKNVEGDITKPQKSSGMKKSRCTSICYSIRGKCENEVQEIEDADIVRCFKETVLTKKESVDVISFRKYGNLQGISIPMDELSKKIADLMVEMTSNTPENILSSYLSQYSISKHFVMLSDVFISFTCNFGPNMERVHELCVQSTKSILNMCIIRENNKKEGRIRLCMNKRIDGSKNVTQEKMSDEWEFKTYCHFKKVQPIGTGLVFCKNDNLNCDFDEWTQWSECTDTCTRNGIVPVRTRTRKMNGDASACNMKDNKLIETEPCLWLPQCPYDDIKDYIEEMKTNIAWEVVLEKNSDLQEWALDERADLENEFMEGKTTPAKRCNIFLGQQQVQNTRLILQVCFFFYPLLLCMRIK